MTETGQHERSRFIGGRRIGIAVGVLAVASWLWGAGRAFAILLHRLDAMPEFMRVLTHTRGVFAVAGFWALVSAFIATIAFFSIRRGHRRVTIPTALVASCVALALLSGATSTTVFERFELMRPDLDAVASLPLVTNNPQPEYYEHLPPDLAHTAVFGLVSVDGRGGVFVPQWSGIPDDAGGFIYWPHAGVPQWDMWGMSCSEPTRLDGQWWACGLGEVS